jgi:hypothetical protein
MIVDPAEQARTFYKWRADTTRMMMSASEQAEYSARMVKAEIVNVVAEIFLMELRPDGTDPQTFVNAEPADGTVEQKPTENVVGDPRDAAHGPDAFSIFCSSQEDPSRAETRKNKFLRMLDLCIAQALKFYIRSRCCRSNFVLRWLTSTTFTPEWMEAYPKLSDKAARSLPRTVMVQHCKYPALWKYGDEEGRNYETFRIIKKAEVILIGLNHPSASTKSDDGFIEVDPQFSATEGQDEAENSNMIEALPQRNREPDEGNLESGSRTSLIAAESIPERSSSKGRASWSMRTIFRQY